MKILTNEEILRTLRRYVGRDNFDPIKNADDSNVIRHMFEVDGQWIGTQYVAQIGSIWDLNSIYAFYVTTAEEHGAKDADDSDAYEDAELRAVRFAIAHVAARVVWLRDHSQRG